MSAPGPGQPRDPFAFPPAHYGGMLTLAAVALMWFVAAPFAVNGHGVLGLSVGVAVGFGLVGTLAARRVPDPVEKRIGLMKFPPGAFGLVLLLVPLVFWLSEFDNIAAELFERPEPPETDVDPEPGSSGLSSETLRLMEYGLFAVFLRPVVEEFFFRGVLQQGAVGQLGGRSGVILQTLLFVIVRGSAGIGSAYALLSIMSQALVQGLLLGALRLGTGSILPGMLLQGLINAVGLIAIAIAADVPITGLNLQDEGHMSAAFLIPSAVSVGLGLVLLRRRVAEREPLPPAEPPEFDDD